MFLSFITKNLNWEILTKNSVTIKRWVHEKPIYIRRNCLKRRAGTVCRFKGVLGEKRREGVFECGRLIPNAPMHIVCCLC